MSLIERHIHSFSLRCSCIHRGVKEEKKKKILPATSFKLEEVSLLTNELVE
jgi:hypothetical protein